MARLGIGLALGMLFFSSRAWSLDSRALWVGMPPSVASYLELWKNEELADPEFIRAALFAGDPVELKKLYEDPTNLRWMNFSRGYAKIVLGKLRSNATHLDRLAVLRPLIVWQKDLARVEEVLRENEPILAPTFGALTEVLTQNSSISPMAFIRLQAKFAQLGRRGFVSLLNSSNNQFLTAFFVEPPGGLSTYRYILNAYIGDRVYYALRDFIFRFLIRFQTAQGSSDLEEDMLIGEVSRVMTTASDFLDSLYVDNDLEVKNKEWKEFLVAPKLSLPKFLNDAYRAGKISFSTYVKIWARLKNPTEEKGPIALRLEESFLDGEVEVARFGQELIQVLYEVHRTLHSEARPVTEKRAAELFSRFEQDVNVHIFNRPQSWPTQKKYERFKETLGEWGAAILSCPDEYSSK